MEKLTQFYTHLRTIAQLTEIEALLDWDQQVNLPAKAGGARSAQLQLVISLNHQRKTDPVFTDLVGELFARSNELSDVDRVNVRETHRLIEKERKLPASLIAAQALANSKGYQVWSVARPQSDFKAVEARLAEIVELKRQEAACLGYDENPYDALFDRFEPYMRFDIAAPLLHKLAARLRSLVPAIVVAQERKTPLEPLPSVPVEQQILLSRRVLTDIGFDLSAGRLDTAPHPFMTNLGLHDLRLTTRYYPENFLSSLFSTLHEMGHGLYEAGVLTENVGTPMGMPVSLGIHESQSRLWENIVGRSRPFADYLMRTLGEVVPAVARVLSAETLWRYLNRVSPSFIRVESDEVTYSLHIVIRMILEERLVRGDLSIPDLPMAWNDLYREYLGINPPNDREGVLQDVHWYSGSIGYFPTYALGNLFSAMMFETARATLPQLETEISSGNFAPLRAWLATHVHEHGMRFSSQHLIQEITGRKLSEEPFAAYLEAKFPSH